MPAAVVDDLELIDVQVTQGVGGFARLGALQRPLHARLELAAIDQTREQIVAGVIGQPAVQFPRLAHVMENQNAAAT